MLCFFLTEKSSFVPRITRYDEISAEVGEKQKIQHSQLMKNLLWKIVLKSIVPKEEAGRFHRKGYIEYYSQVAELSSRLDIFAVDNVDTIKR